MELCEFLQYGATQAGISVVLGWLMSLGLEKWAWFAGLGFQAKRWFVMALCVVIGFASTGLALLVGCIEWSPDIVVKVVNAALAAFGSSQVAHAVYHKAPQP